MSCKKCGNIHVSGPIYRDGSHHETGQESLVYRCAKCGYSYSTPTLDFEEINALRLKDYKARMLRDELIRQAEEQHEKEE